MDREINIERKGFQRMIREIEEDKISTVIVKDMSRFGRDYLKVGFYTEILYFLQALVLYHLGCILLC